MTDTLFKKVDYTLNKLLEDIAMGEIGLPDIQRPFVWPNTNVRDLFDSMYRGYPIGYLLFWASSVAGSYRQIGSDQKQANPRLLIVDGQQRLTSLYAVLKGYPVVREDFQTERIQIAFRPRDQKFDVANATTRNDPEWLDDISLLWSKETSRNKVVKAFLLRLKESRTNAEALQPISEDEEEALTESIDRLYDLHNYPLTALELSSSIAEEQVADVFVRINSQGKKLNQADFILTLMSVFWDDGRAALEQFSRNSRKPVANTPSPFNHFIQPDPDQLLRVDVGLGFRRARLQNVYSILRGKDLETEEFSPELREKQFEILHTAQDFVLDVQNWHEFLKTPLQAGYRSDDMITSQIGLLFCYTLYLIGKRDFKIDTHDLRAVIARWFFMSSITGRYTTSPESIMEQDLARLRDVHDAKDFIKFLDRIVSDAFTEDYWNTTLPNDLATSAARSPSLFAYYAALNLLDARGLFSKIKISELLDPALRGKKSPLEKHHIFPKGYLAKIGITEKRDINQIANFALVEWSDNIDISDMSPTTYYPKYASRFKADDLQKMRYWHALPKDWENMEYQQFLEARRKQIAVVIRDGFTQLVV